MKITFKNIIKQTKRKHFNRSLLAIGVSFLLIGASLFLTMSFQENVCEESICFDIDWSTVQVTDLNDINVDAREGAGNTPLHMAVRYSNDVRIVSSLLEKGADIDATNDSDSTSLHYAVVINHHPMSYFLLSKGAHVNTRDSEGNTPLHYVVMNDKNGYNTRLIEYFSEKGAVMNSSLETEIIVDLNNFSLHESVNANDIDKINMLISTGVIDINSPDEAGNTPLYLAVSNNNVSLAAHLISLGADMNLTNNEDVSLLHVMAAYEDVTLLSLVIKQIKNINARSVDGNTPLHVAVYENNNPKLIEMLLYYGAKINALNGNNSNLLHLAIGKEGPINTNIIDLLLDNKIKINARDNSGNTPLHIAVQRDNIQPELIEFLLLKGANPTIKNDAGYTAFHLSIVSGADINIVRVLLQVDKINTKLEEGETPLHLAAKAENNFEMTEMLLLMGADVNAKTDNDDTPLHYAVSQTGDYRVIELLIEAGADVFSKNKDRKDALMLAKTNKYIRNTKSYKLLIDEFNKIE